jgi:hypothetical protein
LSDAGRPRLTPKQEQDYIQLVQYEIEKLDGYCRSRMRRHRAARIVVIVLGAAVPVFAAWGAVPRVVLGGLGAGAAVAEAIAQLFQYQSMAINTLRTRNALERELNRFLLGVGRYAGMRSFALFAEHVEEIREAADQLSYEVWKKDTTPAVEQLQPTATPT